MAGQGLTMRSAKADCGPRAAEPTPHEPSLVDGLAVA